MFENCDRCTPGQGYEGVSLGAVIRAWCLPCTWPSFASRQLVESYGVRYQSHIFPPPSSMYYTSGKNNESIRYPTRTPWRDTIQWYKTRARI
jgi:hypothetical protein